MMTEAPTLPACIAQKLTTLFAPTHLEIIDQSAAHAEHNPAARQGNTHFKIVIHSAAFAGKSRVEIHRMVFAALQDWMDRPIHALCLHARTDHAD